MPFLKELITINTIVFIYVWEIGEKVNRHFSFSLHIRISNVMSKHAHVLNEPRFFRVSIHLEEQDSSLPTKLLLPYITFANNAFLSLPSWIFFLWNRIKILCQGFTVSQQDRYISNSKIKSVGLNSLHSFSHSLQVWTSSILQNLCSDLSWLESPRFTLGTKNNRHLVQPEVGKVPQSNQK